MASNLIAMASNLIAMASYIIQLKTDSLQPNSNGLQPKTDGLQPMPIFHYPAAQYGRSRTQDCPVDLSTVAQDPPGAHRRVTRTVATTGWPWVDHRVGDDIPY